MFVLMVAGFSAAACAARQQPAGAVNSATCAGALRMSASNTPGTNIVIGPDCVLEVRTADGATSGRLELADPQSAGRLRRVVSTPDLLFVLRGRPASLEVYAVPSLNPITVVGELGLREPTDLVVSTTSKETSEVYVLDNVRDSRTWSDADAFFDAPHVARIRLDRHLSDRRDVLIAQRTKNVRGGRLSGLDEWPVLEAIELAKNELRVVVLEGRQRFAEYFTLDGVLLERQQLNKP